MADFHETRMGQEFYMKNFPKLVKDVGRIANALEGKVNMSSIGADTMYCQKVEENVFAEILSKVSENNVTVGYFSHSICSFRSKSLNRELTFQEATYYLQKVVEQLTNKNIASVENVNGRDGFVYIAFVAKDN